MHQEFGKDVHHSVNAYVAPCTPSGFVVNVNAPSGRHATRLDIHDKFIEEPLVREWTVDKYAQDILVHEIGHLFNLQHTHLEDDGCLDTPYFGTSPCGGAIDCWSYDQYNPTITCNNNSVPVPNPCAQWENISNNIMTYYQPWQECFTPCQLERMNAHLSDPDNGQGLIYKCSGCPPARAFFDMEEEFCINDPFWMDARASFNDTRWRLTFCEAGQGSAPLSNCTNNSITTSWNVKPVGRLNLKNYFQFAPNRWYKVVLEVENHLCEDNQGLNTHQQEVFILVYDGVGCTTVEPEPLPSVASLVVKNNPAFTLLDIEYQTNRSGLITIQLLDNNTGMVALTHEFQASRDPDFYEESIDVSALNPGMYQLHLLFDGELYFRNIVKIAAP
jgi:hypothetical protein